MQFLKIGDTYLNMERVEMVRHCSGDVVEAVMFDGKRIYGSMKDIERMNIVEKISSMEAAPMVE